MHTFATLQLQSYQNMQVVLISQMTIITVAFRR